MCTALWRNVTTRKSESITRKLDSSRTNAHLRFRYIFAAARSHVYFLKQFGNYFDHTLIQDEHIHRVKKSLCDAVKSKHDDLQSVLDYDEEEDKGADAKELSKASLIQQQFAHHVI